jgi:hypothetical protein
MEFAVVCEFTQQEQDRGQARDPLACRYPREQKIDGRPVR